MGTERLEQSELESIIEQVFPDIDANRFGAIKEDVAEVDTDAGSNLDDNEAVDEVLSEDDTDVEEEVVEELDDETDDDELDDDDDEEVESDDDEESDDKADGSDLLTELVTVKVNGEEMQVTVEQAVKGFQLASAANAKFEEASQLRKQSQEAVEFKESFDNLWQSSPESLVAHFAGIADDPNKIVEEVILRVAATGKLSPRIAEALGIDDSTQERLSLKYEKESLEQQRAAEASAREAASVPQADEYGYTVEDYQKAITEMIAASKLGDAPPTDKEQFVKAVFEHGDKVGITNPYLAYASYREEQVRNEYKRTDRATKAVRKVSKSARAASDLSPKGTRQHSPLPPKFDSSGDAAAWALAEVEKKYQS